MVNLYINDIKKRTDTPRNINESLLSSYVMLWFSEIFKEIRKLKIKNQPFHLFLGADSMRPTLSDKFSNNVVISPVSEI